jgi:hypothetical protein
MALSGRHTVEGGGYWRSDNVGPTKSCQFQTPPPFVKGRIARGVQNPTLTVDLLRDARPILDPPLP